MGETPGSTRAISRGPVLRAYLDTSAAVALLFGEPQARALERKLKSLDELLSSGLFVAELLASLSREGRSLADADPMLDAVSLIFVDGSLASECREALGQGHVRGADLWHLATALYIGGREREQLLFISLDERQKSRAKQLGFSVWPATRRAPG